MGVADKLDRSVRCDACIYFFKFAENWRAIGGAKLYHGGLCAKNSVYRCAEFRYRNGDGGGVRTLAYMGTHACAFCGICVVWGVALMVRCFVHVATGRAVFGAFGCVFRADS